MTATELSARLELTGCRLRVDGEFLRVRGPLTDDLRRAIREHKAALTALVRQRVEEDLVPKAPCSRCGGRRFWISRAHGPPTCAACWPPPKNAVWRWITTTE